ncbi:MAG: ribonuclease H family protein, partial [Bacteroidales bacterium]
MKKKYYVVWHGRKTGIYETWTECLEQIEGFQGAKYKGFESSDEAVEAYRNRPDMYLAAPKKSETSYKIQSNTVHSKPNPESIAVDGAWNTKTGMAEYQGVYTRNKQILFRQGPFADGTNNIVEFLGIVHALAYCKEKKLTMPIYSDSQTAITWVKNKKANTK